MPHTTFDPKLHGFHFRNAFDNVTLFGKVKSQGLCGGMAYASLDYFLAGIPVPTHVESDFGAARKAPPEGSRLYKYIYRRIVDSFVNHWEQWMNVALNRWFDPVKFTKRHLPDLLGRLDLGQPVPLGLVKTTKLLDIKSNHQVLAIGYELTADGNSLTIDVYDNNWPDLVCQLTTNPKTIASVNETVLGTPGDTWIAFFPLVDYLVATYTVQNFGEFPAHWTHLDLAVTDPNGTVTALGATPPATLNTGAKLVFTHTEPHFGPEPGIYECRPRYVSNGFRIVLPEVTAGTSNLERVTVVPPGTLFQAAEPEKKTPARAAATKSKRPAARRSR